MVSSTAAATLRQLVMFVVDKVVDEDREEPDQQQYPTTPILLPDGGSADLKPSACDAFSVFEDLCLLANSEKPKFLKLESLHKTFALELIESVLTNYHDLFHKAGTSFLCYHLHLTIAYTAAFGASALTPTSFMSTPSQITFGKTYLSPNPSVYTCRILVIKTVFQ